MNSVHTAELRPCKGVTMETFSLSLAGPSWLWLWPTASLQPHENCLAALFPTTLPTTTVWDRESCKFSTTEAGGILFCREVIHSPWKLHITSEKLSYGDWTEKEASPRLWKTWQGLVKSCLLDTLTRVQTLKLENSEFDPSFATDWVFDHWWILFLIGLPLRITEIGMA